MKTLIDYYLGDMPRRGCTEDSVGTKRHALGRFARAVDLKGHQVPLQEVTGDMLLGRTAVSALRDQSWAE